MGGLTGYLIIGAAIAFFALLNVLGRRKISRMPTDQLLNNQWVVDPATGQLVPAPGQHPRQGSPGSGGHHGGHHGGGFFGGGGHHGGGFSGGGGHHGGGGFSGGGDGGGGGGHHG
jgi:hypothetical protein